MHWKDLMKILNGTVWAYGLLGLMTLGYIALLQSAAMLVEAMHGQNSATLSRPALWFTHLDAAWFWSILAVVSLIGNMTWGRWRAKRTDLPEPHNLPIICHLMWIVTWSFFHHIGFWLSFFKMSETI